MQSTGQTIMHTGQPEHSSGTMTTSSPRSMMAPNSGGQLRRHISQLIHSEISMRRGGFFQVSPRDRTVIRPDRPAFASVGVSFAQGIKRLRTLAFALISYDMWATLARDNSQIYTAGAPRQWLM